MLHENDTILIQSLTDSFCCQLECYNNLRDLVRQLMSRLVLSRGDISQLSEGFRKKQELLAVIEKERSGIAGAIEVWQQRKTHVEKCEPVEQLETILQQVGDAIRGFLDEETQLQKYLEGVISRQNTAASGN